MGARKLQGIDGLNFQLQMTVAGLESINLPESILKNQANNEIVKVTCFGGKLSVFINLPHAIRVNNVQPFQLTDCIKLELVKNQVIDYIRTYLQTSLKGKYSDKLLKDMNITKMECNLTVKCVDRCKTKDVIKLFEKSFAKTTTYKETDDKGKTHKKPERGITTTKQHEWVLKVYDKSYQQQKAGNLKVESNLVRVELVFLNRMLERLYSDKKSLEDILTRKSLKALIDQYQVTFDEILDNNVKPMLDNCVQEVFESLTYSTSGNEISDTLIRCKEYIVDIEVLRKALKKWYKFRKMPDSSKRIISYYRNHKNKSYGIPLDVLKTIKLMHNSTGKK